MIYINNFNKNRLKKKIKYILCDFDRTITVHDSNTCWNFISKSGLVDKSFKDKCDATYEYYRPIELNPNIPFEDKCNYMRQWTLDVLKIYNEYNINKEKFDYILSKDEGIKLRQDFDYFLKVCNAFNIPFYVVSAGIYDAIEYILNKNNLLLPNVHIISNKFNFTNNGVDGIIGDILHSCNKDIIDLPIDNNDYGLLIGDQIEDRIVGSKYDTLDIGFCGEKDLLNLYNHNFDITLTDDSSFKYIGSIVKKNRA